MKKALVTGGSGGIGSAICRALADHHYQVLVCYRSNKETAEEVRASLKGEGHEVYVADVADTSSVSQLARFVENEWGELDVLINNSGVTTPIDHANLDALTDEWIDRIMQTNFRGAFACVRAFEPLMRKSEDALVVNISSVAARTGIGSNVAYCASKAAIDSMTRSLGRALAPDIRVVSVSPGWVRTPLAKNVSADYLQTQIEHTPLRRLATPEDVANTVVAVAEHLTFTTGGVIAVDGGRELL